MSKNKTPDFDDDNPEWTQTDFANAKKPEEIFPKEILAAFPATLKRIGRPIKENKKNAVYIRLSPDVLNHFRSLGKGWQTRIDEALKQWVVLHQ